MSPEGRAAAAEIALLQTGLKADLDALGRHEAELAQLAPQWEQLQAQRPYVALAAVALHAWYTGLENALERIARVIDQHVPAGPRSRTELLEQMQGELPGFRPPVLPSELFIDLDELRKFRHFFRRAYHVELDAAHVGAHLYRLLRIGPRVRGALARFDEFLAASLDQLPHE